MNAYSENYEPTLPRVEDEPIPDRPNEAATDKKHRRALEGILDCIEAGIERSTVIVSKFERLVLVTALLLFSVFGIGKILILHGAEIHELLRPASGQLVSPHSKPTEHTDRGQTSDLKVMATHQSATEAQSIVNQENHKSDSTPSTRRKRDTRVDIASSGHSNSSPTAKSRAQKLIAPFTLRIGIPTTFVEENGVLRARELPPTGTVPSSWGNSQARR